MTPTTPSMDIVVILPLNLFIKSDVAVLSGAFLEIVSLLGEAWEAAYGFTFFDTFMSEALAATDLLIAAFF